jgi:hypothetical protein
VRASRYRSLALAGLVLSAGAGAGAVAVPARAGVVPGQSLDGPSPDLLAVGGAVMAADGGGAVAYLRGDGGVAHVFVVLLAGGVWSTPVRVDGPLAGPAAQPVVAAAAHGRVAVAFVSGGALYATVRPSGAGAFGPPQPVAAPAGDPSLSMGLSGTAYVAYSVPAGDVRAARLDRTAAAFVALPDPLDPQPGGGAGSGPLRRARVVVAADATGLAVWGADGPDGRTHVLARRVYGLHVGSVLTDVGLDQLGGLAGGSADSPDVGIEDDSSYAWIGFRQAFAAPGGTPAARALVRPLVGSVLGAPAAVDSLAFPAADSPLGPSLAIDGVGDGVAATRLPASGTVVGSALGPGGGSFGLGQAVNPVAGAGPSAPAPVAAVSRTGQGLIGFATADGGVAARLLARGAAVGDAPLARPEYGPLAPGGGLAAAADAQGDAIVAYLQGDASARRLAVAAVVNPPGPLFGLTTDHFIRVARPLLQWTASRGAFSPIAYTVVLDGKPVATTAATSLRLPVALADGVHQWQAIARDSLGQQTPSPVRALRIAARPPVVGLAVSGSRRAGAALTFAATVKAPAGLAAVTIDFGDGARARGARASHRYARAGRFTVRVTAVDRLGNRAVVAHPIAIA